MDDQRRRDDVIERELSRAFRAGASGHGAHLDAEAAAAWMERRLDEPDARSFESHLSVCADCQALVATLARVTPEPEAAAGAVWWQRVRRPWLVPAAAVAAVALVIWVALPAPAPVPRLESTQAVRIAPPEPPLPAEPTAPAALGASRLDESESRSTSRERKAAPAAEAPALRNTAEEFARRSADPDAAAAAATAKAAAPAPAPPPPATANVEAAPPPDAVVVGRTPEVNVQAATRAPIAGAAAPAEREERAAAPARQLFDRSAVSSLARARALQLVAADGSSRWRRAGAVIEYAPAAAAAFTPVTLPIVPDPDAIVAGAAPGGSVCWLVGSNGTVLHTINGTTFARVAAPAAVDLVQVVATDVRTATVTAADGRRFRTADQGATWTELREAN